MRFGAVPYLNSKPLLEGLAPLVLDTPARLVERYRAEELDVALLPVAAAEAEGLTRVGDLGIASEGRVESVLLFLRVPLEEVKSLSLDPASRTSRVLVQALLAERHGLRPRVLGAPAGEGKGPGEEAADAELVIGDAALVRAQGSEPRLDLSEEWRRHTGLPFVFAAWYGDRAAAPALSKAYERGALRIDAYVAAAGLDLPAEALHRYLSSSIRYRIGEREEQGLARFLETGRRLGLL
ncbi:MAG: menaquinone biosynthesis protein [Planctomycetes bacterium]|nr:menaquinone biosynthesis protein [Planctomycetota bacterium]